MVSTVPALALCFTLLGADQQKDARLAAPEGWKSEQIELPPPFAPAMKLRGKEDIRFAPGMFQPKSKSFFSYVFVFKLAPQKDLSQEVIERELLVYYRGLATAVSKSRGATVDAKRFSLSFEPQTSDDAKDRRQFSGDLKWVEPFVTQEPQTLHMEIDAWTDSKTTYWFVCVSPKAKDTDIWKTMREIRGRYLAMD